MTRTLAAVVALAVTGLGLPVAASTFTIDDFTDTGGTQSTLLGNPASTTVSGSGIFGGHRFMMSSTNGLSEASTTFFAAEGTDEFNAPTGEFGLEFGNGPGNTGAGMVIYDGQASRTLTGGFAEGTGSGGWDRSSLVGGPRGHRVRRWGSIIDRRARSPVGQPASG